MTIKEIIQSFFELNKNHFRTLKEGNRIAHPSGLDSRDIYTEVHSSSKPVFILSTGRSGTKLMTQVFSKIDSIDEHHEPYPEMSWHNKYAFEHSGTKDEELKMMFDVARYELIRNAFLLDKKYIETNNRITFFAKQISELYPGAKFVHLIRKPVSFVKSGLARNWYSGNDIYDEGRISAGDHSYWNSLTQAKKITWLWLRTNSFVENLKTELDILTIRSEDLFTKKEPWLSLFEHIGISPEELDLDKEIKTPVNRSRKNYELSEEEIKDIQAMLDSSDYYKIYMHS